MEGECVGGTGTGRPAYCKVSGVSVSLRAPLHHEQQLTQQPQGFSQVSAHCLHMQDQAPTKARANTHT